MLAAPSSPIAPAFQQLLPVDVPASVRLLAAEPSASTPRSRCSTPREFSFGLLTAFCSPELVDRVLAECGRQERRCRLLPARLVVYALLLMCLSADLGYAKLMHHLAGLPGLSGAWTAPHKSAFLRARQRLGWEVMERLFRALARPLGEPARDQACLWRGRRELADGSYLVRFGKGDLLTVRVIEYRLHGSGQVYRLLTNLLDPILADALELARLYSERWEVEILTHELKIRQCAGRALRSQTEIGVRQELWAHCLLHTINRQLVYRAALTLPEPDPDRISFSLAQDTLRRSLHQVILVGRRGLASALAKAVRELSALRALLNRRPRSYPRVAYKRISRYGSRASHPSPAPISRPPLQIALHRA